MQERRGNQRHNVNIKVYDENGNLLGLTNNISLKGCSFDSRPNIKMGEILNVYFELPESQVKIKAQCFVKWKAGRGLGAVFNMNSKSKETYLHFIKPWSVIAK